MREAFAVQLQHFFNKKYWHIWEINIWNFNETLTNNVVNFEQPGQCTPYESKGGIMFCPCLSICLSLCPFLCPRDDNQGALCFAPVRLSVHLSHLKSLWNQLLLEYSSNQFKILHRFYQPIEDVHVTWKIKK